MGRIVRITENQVVTTYDYDSDGNVVCVNCHPDAGGLPEFYEHDAAGNVLSWEYGAVLLEQEFDVEFNVQKIKIDGVIEKRADDFILPPQGPEFEIVEHDGPLRDASGARPSLMDLIIGWMKESVTVGQVFAALQGVGLI